MWQTRYRTRNGTRVPYTGAWEVAGHCHPQISIQLLFKEGLIVSEINYCQTGCLAHKCLDRKQHLYGMLYKGNFASVFVYVVIYAYVVIGPAPCVLDTIYSTVSCNLLILLKRFHIQAPTTFYNQRCYIYTLVYKY